MWGKKRVALSQHERLYEDIAGALTSVKEQYKEVRQADKRMNTLAANYSHQHSASWQYFEREHEEYQSLWMTVQEKYNEIQDNRLCQLFKAGNVETQQTALEDGTTVTITEQFIEYGAYGGTYENSEEMSIETWIDIAGDIGQPNSWMTAPYELRQSIRTRISGRHYSYAEGTLTIIGEAEISRSKGKRGTKVVTVTYRVKPCGPQVDELQRDLASLAFVLSGDGGISALEDIAADIHGLLTMISNIADLIKHLMSILENEEVDDVAELDELADRAESLLDGRFRL